MKRINYKLNFVADFETTVYDNQDFTEVWAAAIVELYTENGKVFNSINDFFDYVFNIKQNSIIYFHNLKFDGNFILCELLNHLKEYNFEPAYDMYKETKTYVQDSRMWNKTYKCLISDKGLWYTITIKYHGIYYQFRDSYKIIPLSVKKMSKGFDTKHTKKSIEYKGFRHAGCPISEQEKEYILNDVYVVKEVLEYLFIHGIDRLTIGASALHDYLNNYELDKEDVQNLFPDVYNMPISKETYGYETVGDYVLKSYKGAWTYLVPEKANKIIENGYTFDVNSLYPSMMHSRSENRYPIGKPKFWKGNFIPEMALKDNMYYFIRVETRFYLKDGYLPFIQLKGNMLYPSTVHLKTSDVYNKTDGKYYNRWVDIDGKEYDTRVVMTLTMTDYELIKEHYDLVDFEILDGCYFYASIGLFDSFINYYMEDKIHSTGAKRTKAKLSLNNLYGKFATSTNSSYKIVEMNNDGMLEFTTIEEHNKKGGYIPIGSAITSYSRNFTIRHAQKNYYGADKKGFIYADTDSIHINLPMDEVKGLDIHPTNLCCWKCESSWDKAIFVRQKAYIEHVFQQDIKDIEKPYYKVTCAGMNDRSKEWFTRCLEGFNESDYQKDIEKMNSEQKEFIKNRFTLNDFKIGLEIPFNLKAKMIRGGVVLVDTTFKLRPKL